jgi:hypothetical protein
MKMVPLIDQLQQETDLKVERFETWHNEENAKKLKEYDKGECGGVPYFINTETNETICGEADFETLKKWATKKNEA